MKDKHQEKQTLAAHIPAAGEKNGHSYVRLRQITKTYSNAAGDFTVLKGIDAEINKGEFVVVIGKSGSGKSTLINMISGIDRPTSGEVCIGDVAVHELSENQMATWRGRNLGIVFQFFQLLPMLTLLENIMLPMDFCNMFTPRERRERAYELLRLVGMEDHANKLPSAISGGQQQRAAIARALANDPPLILADEPTGNLDSHTAEAVFQMFEQLISEGKTIIMVTHDSALAKRVSRTILIADGEIVNEWVVRALPTLAHGQMLKATRKLKPVKFKPGQPIIQQDQPGDTFYIIANGNVEVALKRPGGSDVVVSRMGPGEYIGEIELLGGSKNSIATVRAAETPVELYALERAVFLELMAESDITRQMVEQVVRLRKDENLAARRKKK